MADEVHRARYPRRGVHFPARGPRAPGSDRRLGPRRVRADLSRGQNAAYPGVYLAPVWTRSLAYPAAAAADAGRRLLDRRQLGQLPFLLQRAAHEKETA